MGLGSNMKLKGNLATSLLVCLQMATTKVLFFGVLLPTSSSFGTKLILTPVFLEICCRSWVLPLLQIAKPLPLIALKWFEKEKWLSSLNRSSRTIVNSDALLVVP